MVLNLNRTSALIKVTSDLLPFFARFRRIIEKDVTEVDAQTAYSSRLTEFLSQRVCKARPAICICKIGQSQDALIRKAMLLHLSVFARTTAHANLPREHWVDGNSPAVGKSDIVHLVHMA